MEYRNFLMEDFTDMCYDCGNKKYPNVRDMGAIGVALRKCPECGKVKGVVPGRDWAYRAGMFEKVI